jgi:hypothetical protein
MDDKNFVIVISVVLKKQIFYELSLFDCLCTEGLCSLYNGILIETLMMARIVNKHFSLCEIWAR